MNKTEVLLVEDSKSDAFLFQRAVKNMKIKPSISIVQDGEDALEYLLAKGKYSNLDRRLPKVIFMDLKLPKVSGLEVIEKIKQYPETAKIPIVILTSSNEERDLNKAYELGVNSYLVKPIQMDYYNKLISEVTNYWLSMNRTISKISS